MAGRKKGSSKKKSEAVMDTSAKKQLTAVILFALAILLLFIVFIKGQNVWLLFHNTIFGIFGITAFFYPFLLGTIAVFLAMDKF